MLKPNKLSTFRYCSHSFLRPFINSSLPTLFKIQTQKVQTNAYFNMDTQYANFHSLKILNKHSFEPFFVFGSCFRTLAVILFQLLFFLIFLISLPPPPPPPPSPTSFSSPDFVTMYAVRCKLPAARLQEVTGCVNVTSSLPIGRFSEAGLHEWMPFVIFRARSRERSQRRFRANFWAGVASRCV